MTTQRNCGLSPEVSPPAMDFIDLTEESPVHGPSQTPSTSTVRSQRRLCRKREKLMLVKAISSTLNSSVTIVTDSWNVTPTISGTRSGIRMDTRNTPPSRRRNTVKIEIRNATRSGTRNTIRSGTRRVNNQVVTRNNDRVRSTITASNKHRSGINNQCRSEAKLDETISLDNTTLPEQNGPLCANNSTTLICPICLEELQSQRKPTTTRCGHIFCEECLNEVIKKIHKCPQCRTNITKRSCIRLHF